MTVYFINPRLSVSVRLFQPGATKDGLQRSHRHIFTGLTWNGHDHPFLRMEELTVATSGRLQPPAGRFEQGESDP
jgi:hypothetical protein